jgi:hypothetical protein
MVERQYAADNRGIARELARPERMAEHNHRRRVFAVVRGCQQTTELRARAKVAEKVRGDELHADALAGAVE